MDDQKLKTLLSNWFVNTLHNRENEEVLLLFSQPSDNIIIKKSLTNFNRVFSCHISNINRRSYLKEYSPNVCNRLCTKPVDKNVQNLIFCVDSNSVSAIEHLINFYNDKDKHILFALEAEALDIVNDIQKNEVNDVEAINYPEFFNYYLNDSRDMKHGVISLVKNSEMRPHLEDFINYRSNFIKRFFHRNSYLDNVHGSKIKNDLELLKQKNLLTSHLAMHLYRLYFFKPNASSTETGRYFHESLGIASMTYTPRSKKLKNCAYVPNKNFKAYDLSTNIEKRIRQDIASKLIQFMKSNPNKLLDTDTIAEITKLSKKDIAQIFDSYK